MIISASRRTDIPAYYAEWFMNRVRAGFCDVPNPVNPRQVSRVSLAPGDVEVIVFWTRNAEPLLPHLVELDGRGFRYYFLYTLMNNPRILDPGMQRLEEAVQGFRRLSDAIGPGRVVWRYDPIVLTEKTGPAFHEEQFARILDGLAGHTKRCIISFVDMYRRIRLRMAAVESRGYGLLSLEGCRLLAFVERLAHAAGRAGMEIASCAEKRDLRPAGVVPGKCIDDDLIENLFGIRVAAREDPSQRPECRCVASRDIGVYDTCPRGCRYCYATTSDATVAANRSKHDLHGCALVATNEGKEQGSGT